MSPSAATNTSTPCARNTFFGSPERLANTKNLRLIGGGGGGGGGVCFSTMTGVFGCGITTSSSERKILRPDPAYVVCSLVFNRSSRRRGSKVSVRTFVDARRVRIRRAGLPVVVTLESAAGAGAACLGELDIM